MTPEILFDVLLLDRSIFLYTKKMTENQPGSSMCDVVPIYHIDALSLPPQKKEKDTRLFFRS